MSEQQFSQPRPLFYARLWATILTVLAAAALSSGWYLLEWDMALTTYGVASVLACYPMVFRFALWAQRPPTKAMYRRALAEFRNPRTAVQSTVKIAKRCAAYFGGNAFVWKRGSNRWFAHWPIMLGCVMAASIAFPLVFGWVWFRTPFEDLNIYECVAFGIPLFHFATDSFFAFMIFHGLVWASFPVLLGVTVAFIRRLTHRGDQAVQNVADDFMPLFVLFTIAVSGLLLSVSYTWLDGYAHESIAIFHAIVVIMCILWLPYSKLSHVPQRSLKLAHIVNEASSNERAQCSRCHKEFAAAWQIEDLKTVQAELGFTYHNTDGSHYQDICPQCRRANFVLAQGARWKSAADQCQENYESVQGDQQASGSTQDVVGKVVHG